MGISIKEYISEIKISIANDLLSSTEYSIQQISDKIGFSTVQSFLKPLRKQMVFHREYIENVD